MPKAALALTSAIDHSDQAVINANPNTQERNHMSPNVNSFVHDLVAMATAMDRLPVVERELSEAQGREEHLNLDINSLKADLEQSRTYAASLEQKVRTVEAERDDAEIRFLELDEKAHKALGSISMLAGYIEAAESILAPPKPQPEPVVEQRVPDPEPSQYPHAGHGYDNPPASQDQSEVNPTQGHSSSGVTERTGGAEPSGPYTGKRYIEVDGYISRYDWNRLGGTDESYDWRPAVG